ncbi:MAG: hypothetical protein R2706_20960 [Acidimicrobiales bacterium]
MVQEAFIRLSRSLHRIEDPTKAIAYLRAIVLNLARDHNRRGLLSIRHSPPAMELDPTGVDERFVTDHDRQCASSRRCATSLGANAIASPFTIFSNFLGRRDR